MQVLQALHWTLGSMHKMEYGSLLWISGVPTYPSEDACTNPAGGGVHPKAVAHNPETCAWILHPPTIAVQTELWRDGTDKNVMLGSGLETLV
jgi:hypothetical protein